MKLSVRIVLSTLPVMLLMLFSFGKILTIRQFNQSLEESIRLTLLEDEYILTPYLKEHIGDKELYLSYILRGFNAYIFSEEKRIYPAEAGDSRLPFLRAEAVKTPRYYYLTSGDQDHFLYIINSVKRDGETRVIIIKKDLSSLYKRKKDDYIFLILLMILSFLFTGCFLFMIAKNLSRPLNRLLKATLSLKNGKTFEPVQASGCYEVKILGNGFNRMAEALEDKMTLLKKEIHDREMFITSFTHELKTPLTNVLGYSDMILQRELPLGEITRFTEIINKEGKRLHHLGIRLRDFVFLQEKSVSPQKITLRRLCERVLESSSFIRNKKGVELEFKTEGDSLCIDTDLYLTSCLNIIENAVKASKRESQVLVYLKKEPGLFITHIKDRGVGMSEEEIHLICEPYYQTDSTSAWEGLGLGLAITRNIVCRMLKGKLRFLSTPGKGTSVYIEIPLSEEEDSLLPSKKAESYV